MNRRGPLKIVDTTVRDGSHSVAHQFTPEQVATVAGALDKAGVWSVAAGTATGSAPVRVSTGSRPSPTTSSSPPPPR